MADINRVTLMGRLGRDPEIHSMQSGDKVANLRIATSETWKDKQTGEKKERTEWHSVVAFGPLANFAERFLRKGARLVVEGQLRTRKWQDQSGADRYSTEITLSGFGSRIDPIDWPESGGSSGSRDYGDMPPAGGGAGGGQNLDDDIPF